VNDARDKVRRAAGWALVGGLSVAALTAIAALLAGDFGETEWRVIFSSLGFAIASAVAASGATQRLRASGLLRDLGTATAVLARPGRDRHLRRAAADHGHRRRGR
jgi:hypothetical protein